uniref:Uncharacterized protein n=1 Tax=Triticum urartu TaxID=4572 RepID=A0A8R7R4Z7_TRIUA
MVGASWTVSLLLWRPALPWWCSSSSCSLSLGLHTVSSQRLWPSRGSGRDIITS